ncbi:GAD-like domain-containing protein [Deinococcus enclensis]|uniref:Tetratricopeptide (TPR) repeat protein n=1 Tax=Deinococcus enclensis TaxID=1049582 RepID=A0ABT9MG10_9DEIO|nr:GAD-like domain-containing protein [Deinococcus enclensis]MDP9765429.1 tetratricopeptide (TPR) repeat protein [Deinococcus enclensis]
MTASESVSAFLQRFPPAHTRPVPQAHLDRYATRLPDPFLNLWRAGGFGTYGGGLLEVIDPDEYQEILNGWLGGQDHSETRIPFLRSAFGVLFYWRCLGEQQPDGTYEAYDVAYLNPHDSFTAVSAWDADEFLGEALLDAVSEDEYDPYLLWPEVQARAASELQPGVMYGFVPTLRFGGEPTAAHATPMQAREHLSLLLFVVSGQDAIPDHPDPSEALDTDVQTPAEFEAREAQLRAQIEGTDDASLRVHLHDRIARLLRNSPWHALPGASLEHMAHLGQRIRAEYACAYDIDLDPEWMFAQADVLLEYLGDANEAAALYETLLAEGNDPVRARRGLIRRAWLEDDYGCIAGHAQAILDENPEDVDALHDLARARQGLGAYAEAMAHYEAAARLSEWSLLPEAVRGQAECLLLMGEAARAQELLDGYIDGQTDPEVRAWYLASAVTAFAAHGDPAVAARFQQRVVAEGDPEAAHSTYTFDLSTLAELHSRAGQHGAALNAVEEVLRRPGGQEGYTYRLKGDVLAAAGRPQDARAAYQEALRLDPDTAGVQEALAALPPTGGLLSRLLGR